MTALPCPTEACGNTLREGHLLCGPCWRLVPPLLQREVLRAWRSFRQARGGLDTIDRGEVYRQVAAAAKVAAALQLGGSNLFCVSAPQPWPWALTRTSCRVLPQPAPPPVQRPGLFVAIHARDVDQATLRWLREEVQLDARSDPQQSLVAVARLVDAAPAAEVQDPWARGGAWIWRLTEVMPIGALFCFTRDRVWIPSDQTLGELRRLYKDAQITAATTTLQPTYPWDNQ